MSDAPQSPIRKVFQKMRKEKQQYQEVQEELSSDIENGNTYLPSSLRIDGTVENFSPTRTLDGIQQFDESNQHDSNGNGGADANLKGVQPFPSEDEEQMTEDSFVENDTDYDMDANGSAGAPLDGEALSEMVRVQSEEIQLETMSPDSNMADEINGNGNDTEDVNSSMESAGSLSSSSSLMSGIQLKVNGDIITETAQNVPEEQNESESADTYSDGEAAVPQSTNEHESDLRSDIETTHEKPTVKSGVETTVIASTKRPIDADTSFNPNSKRRPRSSILRVEKRPWASQSTALEQKNAVPPLASLAKPSAAKKAVSFADENGGIISEQQTINVSPSKLSRKIRRGKASSAYGYDNDEEVDTIQKGVMGRVLVLLMDPPSKQYELTSLPYPLVSNGNGIVGPTQLKTLLELVAKSASFEPLRQKTYKAFMRPDDAEGMDNEKTILDYILTKDEVLVSIPEGYNAEECARFSKPILQDKRLVKLLKKLKRHERKVGKKKRLKSRGMKPSRHGSESSLKKVQRRLVEDEVAGKDIKKNWIGMIGHVTLSFLIVLLLVGSVQYLDKKNASKKLRNNSMQDNEQRCGRGGLCKPFGVRQDPQRHENDFMARLKDGIKKWKLENDDLLL